MITPNLTMPGSEVRFARLERAYFDLQTGLNQPRAWNAPGRALTVWLRARVPDGQWTAALLAKRGGGHDTCNFNLFSVDLPDTPGPDIGFEIHTERGFFMTSFPLSKIDATTWHDLMGRYDGQAIQILCDGRVMAEQPAAGTLTPNDEPLLIGAETDHGQVGRFFSGEMEEAGLWTRALNASEVDILLQR
jgi:hypothetical protein